MAREGPSWIATIALGQEPDEYGVSLAAYDWDRDGRAELAVGAPGEGYDPAQVRYGQPVSQHGRVHLYCAGGLP